MSLLSLLLDLVFPSYCLSCGSYGLYLCTSCHRKHINYHPTQKCPYCNKSSLGGFTHNECHPIYALDGVYAIAQKNQLLTEILKQIKYRMATDVHHAITTIIQYHIPAHFQPIDFIVPIPSHPKRTQWRGFNYPHLIAQTISHELQLPVQSILIKTKQTTPQADIKNRNTRLKNQEHVFALHPNIDPVKLRHKKFLIIDDVTTTGATLTNAAIPLKSAGASKVWGLVLAR